MHFPPPAASSPAPISPGRTVSLAPLDALQAVSLVRIAEVLFRRRWSIALILASTVVAAAVWVFLVRGAL